MTASSSRAAQPEGQQPPLVSVGIPTFNRPKGLRRTLQQICGQTYPYLEIIVSDNASPGGDTERVVQEFAATDKRVRYVRQSENIGAIANFRYVLAKASGEYFMWASDDDEWDERFVETCLGASQSTCSVMTKFDTVYRVQNRREENPVPLLDPDLDLSRNIANFLTTMQPSLYYGLHRRKSVLFTLNGSYFDFYDCYVVLRIIAENGFRTLDDNLYGAGVDAPTYEVKYANAKKKKLEFWPFFARSSLVIWRSSQLGVREKSDLWLQLARLIRTLRSHHEARASG
jgi:glycosyltransferase involved in cell wall biosynthesis